MVETNHKIVHNEGNKRRQQTKATGCDTHSIHGAINAKTRRREDAKTRRREDAKTRKPTLDRGHDFCNAKLRLNFDKKVNMVRHDFHFNDL